MQDLTYKPPLVFGDEAFALKGDSLVVLNRLTLQSRILALSQIDAHYRIGRRRVTRAWAGRLIVAALLAAAFTRILVGEDWEWISLLFGTLTGTLALILVRAADFARFTTVRFHDRDGSFLFELVRPRGRARRYHDFVRALVHRVRGDSAPAEPSRPAQSARAQSRSRVSRLKAARHRARSIFAKK